MSVEAPVHPADIHGFVRCPRHSACVRPARHPGFCKNVPALAAVVADKKVGVARAGGNDAARESKVDGRERGSDNLCRICRRKIEASSPVAQDSKRMKRSESEQAIKTPVICSNCSWVQLVQLRAVDGVIGGSNSALEEVVKAPSMGTRKRSMSNLKNAGSVINLSDLAISKDTFLCPTPTCKACVDGLDDIMSHIQSGGCLEENVVARTLEAGQLATRHCNSLYKRISEAINEVHRPTKLRSLGQ
eukprot:1185322-Prorocentrum_minimum.AAC.3